MTDTIDVVADGDDAPGSSRPDPRTRAFDIVTVSAEAQAQVHAPLEMKNVAPIAVHVSRRASSPTRAASGG